MVEKRRDGRVHDRPPCSAHSLANAFSLSVRLSGPLHLIPLRRKDDAPIRAWITVPRILQTPDHLQDPPGNRAPALAPRRPDFSPRGLPFGPRAAYDHDAPWSSG